MWIIIGLVLALAALASIVQLFMGGSPGEAWHDDANDPNDGWIDLFLDD